MSGETFKSANGNGTAMYAYQTNGKSPRDQTNPFDAAAARYPSEQNVVRQDSQQNPPAIYMRRLPHSTTRDALKSMFLFAADFIEVEIVQSQFVEDVGYLTAIATFRTAAGAHEARDLLNGKLNTTGDAKLVVEVCNRSPGTGLNSRRNTMEHRDSGTSGSSNGSSSGQLTRQSSRYQFDHASPRAFSNGELPRSDSYIFSQQQSPIGQPLERQRVSGKSVIGEDSSVDDETGRLLNDPVGFANGMVGNTNGNSNGNVNGNVNGQTRRSTMSQLPNRLANLTLSGMTTPASSSMASPRNGPVQSPTTFSPTTPNINGAMGPNSSYQMASQHYMRPNYPPVNPADQNPPCNTLYVGNLPIDTSEDELKAMFSKQRGYKRLCFRTKSNGPMCFVEFEDITFATKALYELYGQPLHNSVKGGIRLSFSKNPLGVRGGQRDGMTMQSPMSPHGPMSALNSPGLQSFTTANGPPPGLGPPGLINTSNTNSHAMNGMASPLSASMNCAFESTIRSAPPSAGFNSGWNVQSGVNGQHVSAVANGPFSQHHEHVQNNQAGQGFGAYMYQSR